MRKNRYPLLGKDTQSNGTMAFRENNFLEALRHNS